MIAVRRCKTHLLRNHHQYLLHLENSPCPANHHPSYEGYLVWSCHPVEIWKSARAHKKGYRFKGWYTAKKNGKKIEKSTICRKNSTLYAQWEKK